MRLSKEEIATLKGALEKLDNEAKLYLFGSRTDDSRRGGDIDLLIVSRKLDKRRVRMLRRAFFERFGEQKVDIIVDDGKMDDPFVKRVFSQAIRL